MQTRIIQSESTTEPASTVDDEVPGGNERETTLRRAFNFLAGPRYLVIGAVHPIELAVGDGSTPYLGIHVVQPLLILFLGWGVWLLVKGIPGRPAQIARIAILPY